MSLNIEHFGISLIGYRDVSLYDTELSTETKLKSQSSLWRSEIALITLTKLAFSQGIDVFENKTEIKLTIKNFQVDNQSKMNPLF